MRKHLFSLFALVLCLGLLPMGAMAAEDESPTQTEVTGEFYLPDDPNNPFYSANSVNLFSDADAVMNSGSTEPEWINRLNIGKDDTDPVRKFYNMLVDATDNSDANDFLIYDTAFNSKENGRIILYQNSDEFTLPTGSTEDPGDKALSLAGEFYNQYYPFFLAAYGAFNHDHPEVFWLNGSPAISYSASYYGPIPIEGGNKYTYTASVVLLLKGSVNTRNESGDIVKVPYDIRSDRYPNEAAITAGITNLKSYIQAINNGLVGDKTAYEKIEYYNNWLTNNNGYCTTKTVDTDGNKVPDEFADFTRDPLTALVGSKSGESGPVCEGYARAFKILCDQADISCTLVSGADHMWNYVQPGEDGLWYAVDVTWNDPTSTDPTQNNLVLSGLERETYLLVGQNTTATRYVLGADGTTLVPEVKKFIETHPVENEYFPILPPYPPGPTLEPKGYYHGTPATTPTLLDQTGTSVTLNPVSVTNADEKDADKQVKAVQYGWSETDDAKTVTAWKDSTTFSNLSKGTTYYFFARVAETDDHYAEEPSSKGLKVEIPAYPTLSGTITYTGKDTISARLVLNSDSTSTSYNVPVTKDGTYSYSISAEPGAYTLIVEASTKGMITAIKAMPITLSESGNVTHDVTLTPSTTNTATPSVVDVSDFGSGSVELVVSAVTAEGADAIARNKIKTAAGNSNLHFINLAITGTPSDLLKIVVDFDYINKSDINVYRYSDSSVSTLTTTNSSGERIELSTDASTGKEQLIIYTNTSGTYAIGYTPAPSVIVKKESSSGSNGTSLTCTVTVTDAPSDTPYKLFCAAYNSSGKMLKVQLATVSPSASGAAYKHIFTFDPSLGDVTFNAFVLDSGNSSPLMQNSNPAA